RNVSICCLSFSLNHQYLVAASHTETVHVFKLESRSGAKSAADSGPHHRSRHRTTSSGSSASQGGSTGYGAPSPDDLDIGGLAIGSDDNTGGPADRGSPHAASDIQVQPLSSTGIWGSGLMGWMGSTLKAYSSYLPHQVSEIFAQDRAFAYCHLPAGHGSLFWTGAGRGSPVTGVGGAVGDGSVVGTQGVQPGSPQTFGLHKVAAVVFYQNQPRLIVAGLDGFVHTFAIDPVNGGEATLLRTQRLLSPNAQSVSAARPLGQGTRSSLGSGENDSTTVCPQLTGGPHHPGVYVTPAPRNVATPVRAPTFAAAVASGAPSTEDRSSPVNQSD
ncbi:WD repeat domain phosphoinositide-interacting protein 2, partial [Fasciola hepatica]